MSYRTQVSLIVLAVVLACPLAAQKKVAETEQEKLGAGHFNEAIAAYSAGDYEKCIPLFVSADSLIGETELVDRSKLRFALGTAYLESGKAADALKCFKLVAEQDPGYEGIQLQMAEAARKAGKRSEALGFYRAALESATPAGQPVILGRIGELELDSGRYQTALEALNGAIEVKPATTYYLLRGQVYDKLAQKLDHAEDDKFDFEKAIRRKEITEEQITQANELRNKALEDYRNAARDESLAAACARFIERSEVILENNNQVISEIRFQADNN